MNISKAELVERLRFLAVWNGGEAWKDQSGGGERWSVPDVLTEAADFIEQSISPPDVGEGDCEGDALCWYTGWDWGAPHTSRESNFAIAGFKAGYQAALSTLPAPDHGMESQVDEALSLLRELIGTDKSAEFHGVRGPLLGKLRTIEMTLASLKEGG